MNHQPLIVNATFKCDDPSLKRIWISGYKRIQELASKICYDTAYYDQFNYSGDTRVQALQALYLSGDDKLLKKSIMDFFNSKTPEYMPNSRVLGARLKIIPGFSLYWIHMIYDYWMHRKDDGFIKPLLPTVQGILDWYDRQLTGDQEMRGAITWWSFLDWDKFNGWGVAPDPLNEQSSIMSFQYAYTLKLAAKLFKAYGDPDCAKNYTELAEQIGSSTLESCYNYEKGLVADNPSQTSFSQYANIWAILSGAVEDKKADEIMFRLLFDRRITQMSTFYKFYLSLALKMVNKTDKYLDQVAIWHRIRNAEISNGNSQANALPEERNSWSQFPNYDLLATICGITSDSPGFKKVIIRPAIGHLKELDATMPHPNGTISFHFRRLDKESMSVCIELPPKTEGLFIWNNNVHPLKSGKHSIETVIFNNIWL
ncbi:alpha-L-rhamnosidase C-terminal domain-containing protein [Pedobacter gandavensis]|uniref:alpha-L-rhamnosidase-related protein n=1 Tax=Pedobacter gandavensis TaxID=2679963 RepID=UPI00292D88B8|nr:alpha-L-rhamnosidase C-terminal domain-containing protein [Pedobacter gandavensis]